MVRYGTHGFAPRPAGRGAGRQLFAGGAGGTARLEQTVALAAPTGRPLAAGTRYILSAELGGSTTSGAEVSIAFLSASLRVLARRTLGPVGAGQRSGTTALSLRALSGRLPPGARRARVTLTLATSLTNFDGPNAPLVGYDRATADALRFSVLAPHRTPAPLRPPALHVPRYDHVFLFYFENQDVHAIVGKRRQAPYFNSLLPQGSELGRFFAEEHPSDANYLALAGGGAFGIPLDDPLEYDSQYTIRARNIGDLVDAAHETWRAYNESAAGPCDDTVHGYYWNDDLPFNYFADIRGRPAYCAAHVLPLESMAPDLRSAATTPSFVWVGANDCDDMEGCGIRAGDRFLRAQLGAIMRSPAWRTQRSLAIVTWDEDAYDHERPAQWVPTLVLGSTGVKRGYVSPGRYTHYSLLRTIEGALGLGTLTANDRYASPVGDIFARAPRARAAAPARASQTAFVVSAQAGTVTPVVMATRRAARPIHVGRNPQAIALTPDDRTAYVVNAGSGSVTPISTATDRALAPIAVGSFPAAAAIDPAGRSLYVANYGSNTVTPIAIATNTAGAAIRAGQAPNALPLTADGATAEVIDGATDRVTPIDTASGRPGRAIGVGSSPTAVAIAGHTAFVVSTITGTVTPISTTTGRAGSPISVGTYSYPTAITLAPGGRLAAVLGTYDGTVRVLNTRTHTASKPIKVGALPVAAAVTR